MVVVGHGADAVAAVLPSGVHSVVQERQGGTGHATRTALEGIGDVTGDTVLVIAGDTPLFRGATLRRMLDTHSGSCTVLTTRVPDPTGYGRVVRDGGAVSAIVEERDTDEITRPIDEVAMSIYVFDGSSSSRPLDKVGTHNDQKEEYLTDVVGILAGLGPVGGVCRGRPPRDRRSELARSVMGRRCLDA